MTRALLFISLALWSGCIFGGGGLRDQPDTAADAGMSDVLPPADVGSDVAPDLGWPDMAVEPCALVDCEPGSVCRPMTGECESICGIGERFCDGACTVVTNNLEHCGRCGNACADEAPPNTHPRSCTNRECVFECDEGYADLNNDLELDGCESMCVPTAADEVCDGIDNDCNGAVDDGLPTTTVFRDDDGDTFGDPNNPLDICSEDVPTAYVRNGDDCNDTEAEIHPGQPELCDGVENDCDPNTVDAELEACVHTVFVTSSSFSGALSSQGGPDGVCQSHGETLDKNRGTSYESWRAIAAVQSVGPRVRLRQIGDVRLPSGATVWDAGEMFQIPQIVINETESATTLNQPVVVWTAAGTNGFYSPFDCLDWTSDEPDRLGRVGTVDLPINYLATGLQDCDQLARLYCIDGQP